MVVKDRMIGASSIRAERNGIATGMPIVEGTIVPTNLLLTDLPHVSPSHDYRVSLNRRFAINKTKRGRRLMNTYTEGHRIPV